mmetsp:Transcript_69251/g.200625  ORF Transcript_69251/g.200625 Transcript_69251/m.200625 type:complete len:364 (-) Transcript_69251:180-1271(-)
MWWRSWCECASMSVTTGPGSSPMPASSAKRRSTCDSTPEKQNIARPRSCFAASRSVASNSGLLSRLIKNTTGRLSGPESSKMLCAVSCVKREIIGCRRAMTHVSTACWSFRSPSKMAKRSSCGMNMTIDGTGISMGFFSADCESQHFSCKFCHQPEDASSVRLTLTSVPVTSALNLSVHSERWGFIGLLPHSMPARGKEAVFLLAPLAPTKIVSHVSLACFSKCFATSVDTAVPRASAKSTSWKCRADFAKPELSYPSGKRPTTFRALSCKYCSTSSPLLSRWSRSRCSLIHFTICGKPLPENISYSMTASSAKSFTVGNPSMPYFMPIAECRCASIFAKWMGGSWRSIFWAARSHGCIICCE